MSQYINISFKVKKSEGEYINKFLNDLEINKSKLLRDLLSNYISSISQSKNGDDYKWQKV
jgi:hypothetical protein